MDRSEWQWYAATALVPFIGALVGFVAGIVFMARSKIGPALALWATAWLATLVWAAIGWGILVVAAVDFVSDDEEVAEIFAPPADEPEDAVPSVEDESVPEEDPVPTPDATVETKSCGNLEAAVGTTTCAFAQNVFFEYWSATDGATGHAATIEAYSDRLGEWVPMSCADGDPVVCTNDDGAEVRMPRTTLDDYTEEAADAYAADHTVSR